MVRKWSYLTSQQTNQLYAGSIRSNELCRFKVFRKTTRFKRFNRGTTYMVRRNYARRKHQTNYLVLSYVTRYWAVNYLHSRQFERFYAAMGRFMVSATSSEAGVFHTCLSTLTNMNGVNMLSCSRTPLRKHLKYSSGASFMLSSIKNTNSAMIQTLDSESLALSTEVFPGAINWDNLLYCYEGVNDFQTNMNPYINFLGDIELLSFQNTLEINRAIYSMLILLTLFNINSNDTREQ